MNYVTTRNADDRTVIGKYAPMTVTLMTLLLVATWGLSHSYKGVVLDGELYAFQAMAKINPALRTDLYLSATSQDEFTFFSPLYALLIRCVGLWKASATLFALCTVTFIVAAWSLAKSLWDETRAWLCAASCIVIVSGYGAYGVFTYSEGYLTARSMAEALVVVALACHFQRLRRCAWVAAAASMLIHPLMALPGLLLLTCLTTPLIFAFFGTMAGIFAALIVAAVAPHMSNGFHFLAIIAGPWLDVVRERSQFLFLQDWRLSDWGAHFRPILCLTVAALTAEQPSIRRLCVGAILVGCAGLTVALIASNIGPVAILLQGQAWRWFWVTGFISVLTLMPAALRLWKEGGCGSVCATLLIASWTFPPADGNSLALAALCLWLVRRFVQPPTEKLLQALAYAMIAAMLAWVVANIWSISSNPPVVVSGEPWPVERLRSFYGLQIPALLIAVLGLRWFRSGLNLYASAVALGLLITLCFVSMSESFRQSSNIGTKDGMAAVSEWREAIPPTSNVLVVPSSKAATFIWFSLERPSYLTTDQSAGVVFSPVIAQEVRRRSEVLLPIMEPDWKIMSQLARGKRREDEAKVEPLTAERLSAICLDPQLGFVIAKETLNFDPLPDSKPGQWKDWNLYSCGRVRQATAGADG